MVEQVDPDPVRGPWDLLVDELRALREQAGTPSYAELTRRLVAQRIADGANEHAAHIARSSVHDAFRLGRSRINTSLTRELVRVLGGEPSVVEEWAAVCAGSGAPVPVPVPVATPTEDSPPPSVKQAALLMLGCVLLNLVGREIVDTLHLPLYLDMVGTAIVAVALGPWRGAAVGVSTNLIGAIGSGWVSVPFAVVNLVGALVWGYGVRRFGMGRTLPRFFLLNLLAALACSLVAVPLLLALAGDSFRDGHDAITRILEQSIHSTLVAVTFANLLTSVEDKLISGFGALVAVSALPLAMRRGVPLIQAAPAPEAGARQQ